jgi:UDP-3-O-[3-hydroxymyristoyl] glucosamine N-acyltransferase
VTAGGRPDDATEITPAARTIAAGEIARLVGGELRGDGDATASAIAPLHRAGAGELSFLASARYASAFAESGAEIVLVSPDLADAPGRARARIVVERPHDAVLTVLPRLYAPPSREPGVHPTAVIGRGATLGADVTIGAYAVIGDGAAIGDGAWIGEHCVVGAGVEIGAETRLLPQVTCYPGTQVGRRTTVHAGARLGSDGFGYVYRDGAHAKIPHVGRCLIGDDVEIGANTTIDRGSIDDTRVGAGTKIDNLVHLGHNVHVGRLCLVMAQVGVAGSARIEDGAVVAGQAGIGGHVTVGARARIAGQAGVLGDVPAGETWSGYPARPHRESLRASAAVQKLPALLRRLERLLAERDPA